MPQLRQKNRFATYVKIVVLSAAALSWLPLLRAAPQPLFDGSTFANWEGETENVWRIEDGTIVGGSLEGNPRNAFLATQETYRNFRLKLEYKLVGTEGFVNGGVQLRSHWSEEESGEMVGYQADIGNGFSGSLYDEGRRRVMLVEADPELVRRVERPGEWNAYEIEALGPQIELSLNGHRTINWVETDESIDREGVIALQIHGNSKAVISFRNITIEELPTPSEPTQGEILNRLGSGQPTLPPAPFKDGAFALGENETVVFVGQENLVREQKAGELESLLATGFATKSPRFRFMAWEADTVYKQWRYTNFGPWDRQLEAVEADIVIVQLGQMEAFDGAAALARFEAAYHQLLDRFAGQTRRFALISPMPFEKPLASHAPDLTLLNDDVAAYAEAVERIAAQRDAVFVDLFTPLANRNRNEGRLTENGIHLTDTGLKVVAALIAERLGAAKPQRVDFSALKEAIVRKNQLWFDCWRPANWSFAYGDRISQKYGKADGGEPSLQGSFEQRKPMVLAADERIHALARGEEVARLPSLAESPSASPSPQAMSPEEELATFTVAEGYEANLFADESDGVANPTQFAWDENGRLYVACSPSYPQSLASKPPRDYIVALEDTDGDGRADKSWRYAEGLTMVQGVEPGPEGLYVCDFDQLVFLADTDGDDRADRRQVIFSGFGIGDTHQLINSISHGEDGSLWFTQGLHAISAIETPWGIERLDRAGVWRFHPRELRLERYFDGGMAGANCWGVAIDDFGQVFHKTGDRPEGYWTVPGMAFNARALKDESKANPNQAYANSPEQYHSVGAIFQTELKTTSLDIIGTKALPEAIQGCALIAGFMASDVELHRFHDDGAGFRTTQLPKVLTASVDAFRPVDVSVGPDGAMYLADWYNPVIGHYQASYADPRRDKAHGRIWRIRSTEHDPVKQPNLADMSSYALLDQLRSPERWTRYQAKRLLYYQPTEEVLAAADKWVARLSPNDASFEKLAREVAGVYLAHEAARPKLLDRLLVSSDYRIRAYAAMLLGSWAGALEDPLAKLRHLTQDSHPRVRLSAALAASYVPAPESVAVATQVLKQPTDRFIEYALRQSARALEKHWAPALASGTLTFADSKQETYLRQLSSEGPPVASPGAEIYNSACMVCHQPQGVGLAGMYPPLANSDWVSGDPQRLIRITLHGLKGPIALNGQRFDATVPVEMPAFAGLSDKDIADVLTYLRHSFGNDASPISPEDVKSVRNAHRERSTPWTQETLPGN